jgi:predicted XRE-type DNA-binding protein
MDEISGYLKRERMTQEEAAELFGVSQPRISDIARGKISRFTIDALVRIAVKAGLTVDLRRPARTKSPAVAGKEHGLGIR